MPTGKQFAELACNSKYERYTYDQIDCQGFVERVLSDLGVRKPDGSVYNWRGSNSMYRNYFSWRGTKEEAVAKWGSIPVGAFVYVWEPTGEEERGYHDGLGNAKHVGIYCGEDLVRDSTRYKDSSGGYARNGPGNASLKHFNRVTIPSMLDFAQEPYYNDYEELITMINNIRNELNLMEDKIDDIYRNNGT